MSEGFLLETIPEEDLLEIVKFLTKDLIPKAAVKIVINLALVNNYFHMVMLDRQIWKTIASSFNDYVRLEKRYKSINIEWRDIVKERLSGVFIEREIIVGPRDAPERRHLIQVHGNGYMYIGTNIPGQDLEIIRYFNRFLDMGVDDYDVMYRLIKYNSIDYIMQPFYFNLDFINNNEVIQSKMNHILNVADISTYDPFLLVLTSDGHVIEFMFKPSNDSKWDDCAKSRLLEFSILNCSVDAVEKIYALDYACFALSNGRVWCWSIIDHPDGTRHNIKTKPIRLDQLEPYYIYFIRRDRPGFTKCFFVDRRNINDGNQYLYRSPTLELDIEPTWMEIPDEQIMALIGASVFTDDEITAIAERVDGLV